MNLAIVVIDKNGNQFFIGSLKNKKLMFVRSDDEIIKTEVKSDKPGCKIEITLGNGPTVGVLMHPVMDTERNKNFKCSKNVYAVEVYVEQILSEDIISGWLSESFRVVEISGDEGDIKEKLCFEKSHSSIFLKALDVLNDQ